MHLMKRLSGAALLAVVVAASASTGRATEYHIKAGSPGGDNYYSTLEDLRQALYKAANPDDSDDYVDFKDGDVIILHNDDASLAEGLILNENVHITIRSAGGARTISAPNLFTGSIVDGRNIPDSEGGTPGMGLTLDGVNIGAIASNAFGGVKIDSYAVTPRGSATISNSVISTGYSNMAAVQIQGNVDATIRNTNISGNMSFARGGGLYIATLGNDSALEGGIPDTANVTLALDANGPDRLVWKDNTSVVEDGSRAMFLSAFGELNLNVDVAAGKNFYIADTIKGVSGSSESSLDLPGTLKIEKTGGGVWKLGGPAYAPGYGPIMWSTLALGQTGSTIEFTVKEGTLHLTEHFFLTGDSAEMKIESGAVFKPSITAGDLEQSWQNGLSSFNATATRLYIKSFTAAPGSRLAIGGVSSLPTIGSHGRNAWIAWAKYGIGFTEPGGVSIDSSAMRINNPLLSASLETDDGSDVNLLITYLADLSTLPGVNYGADVFRRLPDLTDEQREFLDDIYLRGSASDSDLSFLQSLDGSVVSGAMIGIQRNAFDSNRKIRSRITSFQEDEIKICSSDGSEYPSCYGDMWAFIDQTWLKQDDIDNVSGYRYAPTSLGIGYDWHNGPVIVGGLLRYDRGDFKIQSCDARTRTQSATATAYASYAQEALYITGSVQAGMGWNDSRTGYGPLMGGLTAESGTYSSMMLGAGLEIGFMKEYGAGNYPLRATPYFAMDYGKLRRAAFAESGAGNLNRQFRRGDWNAFEMTLGLRADKPWLWGNTLFIASADVAWAHLSNSPHEEAAFISQPTSNWELTSVFPSRDAFRMTAGLEARLRPDMGVGLDYELEMRKQFIGNRVDLNFYKGF